MSSAFAYPIDVEAAGLDLAVTSSSKAIGAVPGLGIVLVRAAFLERLRAARGAGYYLDLVAECDKQRRESQPRFAQPVALYAALAAACAHLRAIGVEAHMARMQRQMQAIVAHLDALGIPATLPAAYRSGVAVNFRLPRVAAVSRVRAAHAAGRLLPALRPARRRRTVPGQHDW